MGIDFIDISLDKSPVDNTGDNWESPFGWPDWLDSFNRRGDKDMVFLGCDHGYLIDRYTYEKTYSLTASGTELGNLYLGCGNIGSRIEPSVSQNSWWFIGDRPEPMRRQMYNGSILFLITGNYLTLEGVKAKNYQTVFEIQNPLNGCEFLNLAFRNVRFGARFNADVDNIKIDQLVGRNATASLLFFGGSVTNSSITNVTLLNTNVEDGEAIGIRLLGHNNQNVRITDIISGGQHDHYLSATPKNPYHDGSEYSPYTQGEVLAIEGGSGIEIERVIGFNCTDRLIDCKAQCVIRDCGGTIAKRGITMWAEGSHAYNCIVKSTSQFGNTPASAYLVLGNDSSLVDCEAFMLTRGFKATIIVGQAATIRIVRGRYLQPPTGAFLSLGYSGAGQGPTTVILEGVEINGKVYNQSINLPTGGAEWVPD